MADYSEQQQSAYDNIAEAGGTIVFKRPPTNTAPADPDAPWEGNAEDPEDFTHVGVLLPLSDKQQNPISNHRILIPAKGLPFEIQMEQQFTDSAERTYAITAISLLAPDPTQLILFDCECALWPER
jgi:hypothetical protein